MKTVDYFLEALKYHGGRNDGFLTDQPVGVKLAEDDIVRVRYDAQTMRWIANRPSRIKYPTVTDLEGKAIDKTISQRVCGKIEISRRAGCNVPPISSTNLKFI